MLLQNRTFPFPFKRLYLCVLLVTLSYSSCSEPIKINKVDHFKKSLLNLLQHCFSYFNVLVFWPRGMWEVFCSQTRARTRMLTESSLFHSQIVLNLDLTDYFFMIIFRQNIFGKHTR